jgi:hypothetical protein
MGFNAAQDEIDVAIQILELTGPCEVQENLANRGAETRLIGVVAAIGWRIGFDVFRGNRRTDENEIVVEIGAMQYLAEHRIEERFRQFGLLVVCQQADELELGLLPDGIAQIIRMKLAVQTFGRLPHTIIVELDPVAHGLLHLLPARLLEAPLGEGGALLKEPIVLVKAVDQNIGDGFGDQVIRGTAGMADIPNSSIPAILTAGSKRSRTSRRLERRAPLLEDNRRGFIPHPFRFPTTINNGAGMSTSLIKVPAQGQKIIPGQPIPDNPVIPLSKAMASA